MTNDPQAPRPLDYFSPEVKPRRSHWRFGWAYYLASLCLLSVASVFVKPLLNSSGLQYAPRSQCTSHLVQLGMAMTLYANGHDGQYPPSLATLLVDEQIAPQVFICPDSKDTPATGATPQTLADDLERPAHCSYIYLGQGLTEQTATATTVVAYEPLADHHNTGMNVLFGDGHVTWETPAVAAKLLAKVAAFRRPVTMP